MLKISIIGAGSCAFTKKLVKDILSFKDLRESIISLMDIDEERLNLISAYVRKLITQENFPTRVQSTTDRKKALKGAEYVIATFDIGGLEARKKDIEISRKYGVNQAIGDTLGPGGVFKAMRVVPVLLDLCKDIEKCCPEALLINYTNPMAINTWAINKYSNVEVVGLCHGLERSTELLASFIGAKYEELSHLAAGINHMTWFLQLKWNGKDAYPILRERMKDPSIYSKASIRFELMERMGYFMTESCYHTAEYVPFFKDRFQNLETVAKEDKEKFKGENLKKPMDNWEEPYIISKTKDNNETEQNIPIGWDLMFYEKVTSRSFKEIKQEIESEGPILIDRSCEYTSRIIHSMETGTPRKISGNVMNEGLVSNLPWECCVEVPCLVDGEGIHPTHIGKLPYQCAALNRTNINVQELAVEGIVKKDKEAILRAITLDPLTSVSINLSKIKEMVEEMFKNVE